MSDVTSMGVLKKEFDPVVVSNISAGHVNYGVMIPQNDGPSPVPICVGVTNAALCGLPSVRGHKTWRAHAGNLFLGAPVRCL